MIISPYCRSSPNRFGWSNVSTKSRAATLRMERKKPGCRMTTGMDLGNSSQNIAGSQNVFHGALLPGGFKYAEQIASKPTSWSCLLYTLSRQNLTHPEGP